jgi:hypothetical protein
VEIHTTADCHLEMDQDAGPTITRIDLQADAEVPDVDDATFVDRDTQFGGDTLPVTFSGDLEILLRDIDPNENLGISAFVDPAEADIVVTLEFADGSTRTIGLG